MSARTHPVQLSFQRIVDIPFETCVTVLEGWQLTVPDGGRRTGQGLWCGPAEYDRDSGTYRAQVRLSRGPLHPVLRMRLDIDHWSLSRPQTALELIPCRYVRPSAAYFRAGHLLLDRLALSLGQATRVFGTCSSASRADAPGLARRIELIELEQSGTLRTRSAQLS